MLFAGKFHTRVGLRRLPGSFHLVILPRKIPASASRVKLRSGVDARDVVDGHVRAHHGREVQNRRTVLVLEFLDLRVVHRAVAGAEIHRAFGHLLDAAAGTDRLIVELRYWETSCGIRQTTWNTSDRGTLRLPR